MCQSQTQTPKKYKYLDPLAALERDNDVDGNREKEKDWQYIWLAIVHDEWKH